MTFDEATEAWFAATLAAAPPPNEEQIQRVIQDFATPPAADVRDAA